MTNKYSIEEIVYLKTDPEQLPRMVTCIELRKNSVSYQLSCGTQVSYHYDFEISKEKDVKLM